MGISDFYNRKSSQTEWVDVSRLQVGMYVELELGWMDHPFASSSFKITATNQIDTITALGLTRVRYVPLKSDEGPLAVAAAAPPADAPSPKADALVSEGERLRLARAALIRSQQNALIECERRFHDTTRSFGQVSTTIEAEPDAAYAQCLELVNGFVDEMTAEGDTALRLLSELSGDKSARHAVHVTVLSLLLGHSVGLNKPELQDLGMAAFLHDIGKLRLPQRVRMLDEAFSPAEYKLYQDHVAQSLSIGRSMSLSEGSLRAIGQHHEMIDASGFPGRLRGDALAMSGKILALVNRYENMCNPFKVGTALTPHEALSMIFAQLKSRFDSVALSAFIRMMGVYPPGSIVQLSDERYAIVVSVNTSRPLKPRVIVHEPSVSKHEALILDLEQATSIGIRRSLKPSVLPAEAALYLSPRQRISYFFEKSPAQPGKPNQ